MRGKKKTIFRDGIQIRVEFKLDYLDGDKAAREQLPGRTAWFRTLTGASLRLLNRLLRTGQNISCCEARTRVSRPLPRRTRFRRRLFLPTHLFLLMIALILFFFPAVAAVRHQRAAGRARRWELKLRPCGGLKIIRFIPAQFIQVD